MKNRNTGLLLVLLGMIFFMITKMFSLSSIMWGIFLGINIVLNVVGVLIIILYMRNEKKNRVQ